MTMNFTDLIRTMPRSDDCPDISKIKIPRNYEEYLQWQCEAFNRTVGDLEGYDCPECLNRGYISGIADDVIVQRECNCMKIRNSPFRIENSGLKKLKDFDRFTFDMYRTDTEWRKRAKTTALKYVKENNGKWLFFGGQSGTGKTHLCTAICKKLIIQGHDVKYVLWRDILHFLDSNRFNYDSYREKGLPSRKNLQSSGRTVFGSYDIKQRAKRRCYLPKGTIKYGNKNKKALSLQFYRRNSDFRHSRRSGVFVLSVHVASDGEFRKHGKVRCCVYH